MGREAEILLGDLHFERERRFRHRAEQRREGLARLEIHGAVLDLEDDVGGERAVERLELAIRLPGAVLGIVGRIDEGAPDDDAVVRAKRGGKPVGALGMAAGVVRWAAGWGGNEWGRTFRSRGWGY